MPIVAVGLVLFHLIPHRCPDAPVDFRLNESDNLIDQLGAETRPGFVMNILF